MLVVSTTKDDVRLIDTSDDFDEEWTVCHLLNTQAMTEFVRNFDREKYPALIDNTDGYCTCDFCQKYPGYP